MLRTRTPPPERTASPGERRAGGAEGAGERYLGYTYAYPHKTAYRPFPVPRTIEALWAEQPLGPAFLYFHVPFCEFRCGFCNLFTRARAPEALQDAYVSAVEDQTRAVRAAVGPRDVELIAFGGGTPTRLSPAHLQQLLELPERYFSTSVSERPTSIETSPETATPEQISLLAEARVSRVSIGIQSFVQDELTALGRPIGVATNEAALDRIRAFPFNTLNIDLIYGIAGQSVATWLQSVERALAWSPEELFLYPLYVRPLTGLGRRKSVEQNRDLRPEMYARARARLLEAGYRQFSMRSFRRGTPSKARYRCQSDGMIGLGCGARSYTDRVHYSSEWAASARGVKSILEAWIERANHSLAEYGFELDRREQKIRHLLQSLLNVEGVERDFYRQRFGTDPLEDFEALSQLAASGLVRLTPARILLTEEGLGWSDAVGPWLYSEAVKSRMDAFELQ